ncbi:MAG: DNA repair protein RadA [Bacteroidales bacterium]|nr:DNA repair protein RadA [Bacteroidales bacterium]
MAKSKTAWFCSDCGAESPKWIGRCPSCGEWNTYVEEKTVTGKREKSSFLSAESRPEPVGSIAATASVRLMTGMAGVDRILGGGLVPGSLVLFGGEPGIGKSTLALQIAMRMEGRRVLYISGEESGEQIKLRAERVKGNNSECYIYSETSLENIFAQAEKLQPELIIIDSIQTISSADLESSAGSVSQVRESAARILKFAKQRALPVLLIGHITKDGTLAGPKILEHIVDVVLQFEGDNNHFYRILRAAKNRFGATSELGIFEMQATGLREVDNPGEMFVTTHEEQLSGIAIASTIDGIRPFMIETQALVSSAVYGTPQRSSTGFDTRRLNMLLAVLEKRAGFRLASRDVFINIAGGLKVNDPAVDMALVAAVLSSNLDIPVNRKYCFAGETGLSGEIRPVSHIDQRISEAARLGYEKIFISKYSRRNKTSKSLIEVVEPGKIEHLVKQLFSGKG